ncbi:MAG: 50S ribosomal protein L5 [Candidatus Thermoplasmatota archaeon]
MNPMRLPSIDKVVVNIGRGKGGEELLKGEKVLEFLTNQKPIKTVAKITNKDWGVKRGMTIGCKVTLRHKKAEEFIKQALFVKGNRLPSYSFDRQGNVSFGITDYTAFPGMKYNPEIGIIGMDVCISLARKGIRIKQRKIERRKLPKAQILTKEESIEFMKNKFGIEIIR